MCYFMLSKSISLLLMPAQQPVSFCCISCLVACKCGSKHTGIEKKVIVFDTCYEAGQLFATGGQPVFFFSNTPKTTSKRFTFAAHFLKKVICQPAANKPVVCLCVSCLYFVFSQLLDDTDSEKYWGLFGKLPAYS